MTLRYLVFSGGHIYGVAYIGALCSLGRATVGGYAGFVQQIRGTAGSSIGSVFALLVVLRMPLEYVYELIRSEIIVTPGQKEEDEQGAATQRAWVLPRPGVDFGFLDLVNLTRRRSVVGGLLSTQHLQDFVQYSLLERCLGPGNWTFEELYQRTGTELVVQICRVNERTGQAVPECHGRLTTPHECVASAVAASCAMPYLFAPMPHPVLPGHWLIDGGVLENLPLAVFPAADTLGLRLCTPASGTPWTVRAMKALGVVLTAWKLRLAPGSVEFRDLWGNATAGHCPGSAKLVQSHASGEPTPRVIDITFPKDPVHWFEHVTDETLCDLVQRGYDCVTIDYYDLRGSSSHDGMRA
jgi:predicted acylesterase/phospholipase RssA